jgi:hypothetical protein
MKARVNCGIVWFEIKDLQCFKLLSWEEKSIVCVGLYLSRLSKSEVGFFDKINSSQKKNLTELVLLFQRIGINLVVK